MSRYFSRRQFLKVVARSGFLTAILLRFSEVYAQVGLGTGQWRASAYASANTTQVVARTLFLPTYQHESQTTQVVARTLMLPVYQHESQTTQVVARTLVLPVYQHEIQSTQVVARVLAL